LSASTRSARSTRRSSPPGIAATLGVVVGLVRWEALRSALIGIVVVATCAVVASVTGDIAIRDGKRPHLAPHVFSPEEWDAFLAGALAGEFDREKLDTSSAGS
jgi:hypothetical protein